MAGIAAKRYLQEIVDAIGKYAYRNGSVCNPKPAVTDVLHSLLSAYREGAAQLKTKSSRGG
jgi:hypothetical protein